MKIGLFGITANPPHLGHLAVIKEAAKYMDEVWVSLVYQHPFGKNFIDYESRLEMLKLLLINENSNIIKIKELDKEYYHQYNKIPYSYNLLSYVKNIFPNNEFKLVIGEDNYKPEVWKKFYEYEKIEKEFGLIIVEDQGFHSTDIRSLINKNSSIVSYVGKEVENYIINNNLFNEVIRCKI